MLKEIDILVNVRYFYRGFKVFQHFIFIGNRKNIAYIFTNNLLYAKLIEKIKQRNLSNENFTFLQLIERADRFVVEYEIKEKIKLKNEMFHVIETISTRKECNFCKFYANGFCNFKGKEIKYKNSCSFFKQKEVLKT